MLRKETRDPGPCTPKHQRDALLAGGSPRVMFSTSETSCMALATDVSLRKMVPFSYRTHNHRHRRASA